MSTAHTPTVGVVYNFTFAPGYDAFNGVYRLTKLSTYDQYLGDGGNLLNDFYTPNGKTQEDLDRDLSEIRSSKIMQLSSPETLNDGTVRYAPLCFLQTTPDHNVHQYQRFGIIAQIGITDDPTDLDFVRTALIEHIEAATGITPDPRYVTLAAVWMTEAQYAEEVAKRDETKKHIINYYSENQRLQQSQAQLQTLLKQYETTIIKQQQQLEKLQQMISTVPLTTITFAANGGSGEMATVQVYRNSTYILPECQFTAPEGMTFNAWCDAADGVGTFLLAAGANLDLATLGDEAQLYATWKAADAGTESTS